MDPKERIRNPALLIVDMRNDFVRGGAPLEVADARPTIPAHRRLIGAFRERGLPIVFTRFLSTQEYSLLWERSPQCHPETKPAGRGILACMRTSAESSRLAPAPP